MFEFGGYPGVCKLQQACCACTLRSDLYVEYCRPGGLVARGKGFEN